MNPLDLLALTAAMWAGRDSVIWCLNLDDGSDETIRASNAGARYHDNYPDVVY